MKNVGKNKRLRRNESASANDLIVHANGTFGKPSVRDVNSYVRSGHGVRDHRVFIGPCIEGKSMTYVKALSGTVEDRKPSYL